MTGPLRGSKSSTQTYVPVIAGTAQATMIALVRKPRAHGPSRKSSSATRVPMTTVRAT